MSEVEKHIGAILCADLRLGKSCPHHEQQAKAMYAIILQSQRVEREREAAAALERLATK